MAFLIFELAADKTSKPWPGHCYKFSKQVTATKGRMYFTP